MKVKCHYCDTVDDTAFMDSHSTGRERLWVCPKCYRAGDKQVIGRLRIRHEQIERNDNAKRSRNN